MSDYTELKGLKVKYLAADPDPGTAGDVWYNTTTELLKAFVGRAAWSAGSLMNTARGLGGSGGAGTQTAALVMGGLTTSPSATVALTEEYNGSGWSTGEAVPVATKEAGAAGTQTAALLLGGETPAATQVVTTFEYDGTDYASGGDLPAVRRQISGAGIQTAGLAAGGYTGTAGATETFEYNGTAWTDVASLSNAHYRAAAAGTQTSGLMFSGDVSGWSQATEEYDGSSWTAGGNVNVARYFPMGGGGTSQTSALFIGGYTPPATEVASTESYDGTSWTEGPDLGTARSRGQAHGGDATSGLASGGIIGDATAQSLTEEYNVSFKVTTAGAWASGGNLTTGRWGVGNFGTQTAAVAHGGAPATALVEEYDGSSWTEVNNVPAAGRDPAGLGTLTAGLALGGGDDPKYTTATKEYDGTNWTEGGAMNTARGMCGTGGTQTAGLVFAGEGLTAAIAKTEEYNGTSWTENPNDFPSSVATHGGGTQTAAVGVAEAAVTTFEYDGSSWTAGGNTGVALSGANAGGSSQTDILRYGGSTPAPALNTATEGYDGTSWSTRPSMATGRVYIGKGNIGTTSSGLGVGGYISGASNATEEFTGETSAETASTIDFD